jgi:hypothetical protein
MIYRAVQDAGTPVSPAAKERSQGARLYQFPYREVSYPADVRMDDPNEEFAHPSLIVEIAAAAMAFVFWLGWRATHPSPASR